MVDFKDSDDLRKWLEGKSWEVPAVMVARAALRVLPILSRLSKDGRMREKDFNYIVSPVFRAMSLTIGAAKYQMVSGKLFALAVNAADDLAAANEALASDSGYITDVVAYASRGNSNLITYAIDDAGVNIHDLFISVNAGFDATFIDHGAGSEELQNIPLWQNEMPEALATQWRSLKQNLLGMNEDWQVWTDWYEDILAGRNRAGLPDNLAEELDLKIALQENDWWVRGPAKVNGDIKAWTDAALADAARRKADESGSNIEPEPTPGPQYDIIDGKLTNVEHFPTEDELSAQESLHNNLRKQIMALASAVVSLENQYPTLVGAIKEYVDILANDIDEIDVTAVWSVGGAVSSFQSAYAQQSASGTLEIPLEPNIVAQLQSISRMHGAFVMGFAEGRELVERADAFLLDEQLPNEIESPGNIILEELSNNQNLVDEDTRAKHRPVSDAVHELGWGSGRNGYAAYAIVKNGTIATAKFVLKAVASIVVVQGVSTAFGDPNMEVAKAAVEYLRTYGSHLLSFFSHSPEMRAYIEHALKMIVDDVDHNSEGE